MTSIYNTGTVTVTNGSATVVGTGTAWAVGLVTGGQFSVAGVSYPILSVTDDTHLTLALPFPGTTASGLVYAINRENSNASNIVDLYDKLTRVLITLSLAGITPNDSGNIADRDALTLGTGDRDFLFLHAEIGVAFAFYRWTGTAWDGPFPVANAVATGGVSSIVGSGITVDNSNPAIPSLSVANDAITNGKLANMANATIKGRTTAGTGDPEDLTITQTIDLITGTPAQGDLLYRGSSAWQRLAKGAFPQTLRQNSALTAPEWGASREVLTANRTYYVRTDGSDSNTGLVDTAGGAFLTVQKALNAVAALDCGTSNVTIQLRTGTRTASATMGAPLLGSGTLTIVGDTVTPANVVWNVTSGNCLVVQNGAKVTLSGVTIRTTTGGIGLYATGYGSIINIGASVVFGASATAHMSGFGGGIVQAGAGYTIAGAATYHALSQFGGQCLARGFTITLTGTPAISVFARASETGIVAFDFSTFSGSATGQRYQAASGGTIITNGAGATFLPGNAAGTVSDTGSAYY